MAPLKRSIKRLLVANRGEIALRIIQAAREYSTTEPLETYALYTPTDASHARHAHHAIALPSPSSYMDISLLVSLAKKHSIDAVHPGYGFLSESAEFASRMWEEAGCMVVGPGADVLARTGDKLLAKVLARECDVPVLESMEVEKEGDVEKFVARVRYPVMVKAVDGGGGRGIRLVQNQDGLKSAVDRAKGESPSGKVFLEKAAVGGFHHVEVQVFGDGEGGVGHLWERDCSVQRRYQKVVEVAPALMRDRKLVGRVIQAALRMAKKINYLSLGTFEFLVSEASSEFYFLEINPRLQVEHTITECITTIDLVHLQLSIAQGVSLKDSGLGEPFDPERSPQSRSIQLRLCAEDPSNNFSLSIGKINEFHMPTGNGIRIDTQISTPPAVVVGSDFDNLLAKIIVTSFNWEATVRKARRALEGVRIEGVKTNLNLLRGIVGHPDFESGQIDTRWLETNIAGVVDAGNTAALAAKSTQANLPGQSTETSFGSTSQNVLFRKGDGWDITLSPLSGDQSNQPPSKDLSPHHFKISRVLRNEFPASLSAEIEYTIPPLPTQNYELLLTSSASGPSVGSSHRMGDLHNTAHICLPLSGKLIEVMIEEGDIVEENAIVAFVKQMKMELEVRSPRRGRVLWALELENEEGEEVREGTLLAEIEEAVDEAPGPVEMKGKL